MATIQGRFGKLIADFYYLGIRCREKTSLEDNPANRKKLATVLKKMEAEITLGIFDYGAYFPKSTRLKEMTTLSMVCPFDVAEKQALLEAPDGAERARMLVALMRMGAAANAPAPEGRPS